MRASEGGGVRQEYPEKEGMLKLRVVLLLALACLGVAQGKTLVAR
jgi:hypothetical protein